MFVNMGRGQEPQLLEHLDHQLGEKEVPTLEWSPTPKANRQVCNGLL